MAAGSVACSSASPPAGPALLTRDALLDPESCQGCHPNQFREWAQSMHAYASSDPVFVAMNGRGQRETGGELGAFCVNCHAPMAVRDGLTGDGLNLATLPSKYQGVTCFFCHSVASVQGTHDAALSLATDDAMRGEYANPAPGALHASAYSALHDGEESTSASMCGACHDIVNGLGAPIERTFCEWSQSAFAAPVTAGGQPCVQCHMDRSTGPIAAVAGAPVRTVHAHDFPAVDVSLAPVDAGAGAAVLTDAGPTQEGAPDERSRVQQFLASSFQGALCVTDAGGIRVVLDPVFLGHDWPSGASQDRRAWAEVVAYQGASVVYQSGVVADGGDVVATATTDPDLWLLRDRMFDTQRNPVNMFWQAATTTTDAVPALATFSSLDPRFYNTHVVQLFPRSAAGLAQMPDRVTFRMRLQPVGADVVADLVASGDLAAASVASMPTWDVSFLAADGSIQAGLTWTLPAATATYLDPFDQTMARCVSTFNFYVGANKVRAPEPAAPSACAP